MLAIALRPFHCVFRAANDTVRVVNGEVVTFTRDEPLVLSTLLSMGFSDGNGMVTLPVANTESQPVQIIVQAWAGEAESQFTLRSMWNPNPNLQTAGMRGSGEAVAGPTAEEKSEALRPATKKKVSEPSRIPSNKPLLNRN